MAKKEYKVGDIVSVRGQVVDVDDTGAVTVEVASNDRRHKDRTTFNAGQVSDAFTFVERGEVPEPDAVPDPFAGMTAVEERIRYKRVEEADAISTEDNAN